MDTEETLMTYSRNQIKDNGYIPRVIAWEVTRRCPMSCLHCRAASRDGFYAGELSTAECFKILENIASFAQPIVVLTGGEPLSRNDIFRIARYGSDLGLRMVMAPCGLDMTAETARHIREADIKCISISVDGAKVETHDAIRGRKGAFESAMRTLQVVRDNGLSFQINTVVSKQNVDELPALLRMAEEWGADTFNPFMLVPTGRGREMGDQQLNSRRYESVLNWLAEENGRASIPIRVTCGPQYQRILRQIEDGDVINKRPSGGCLGGKSFAFISHRGKVQICGFLDLECGDLRQNGYNFQEIWHTSPIFREVRQVRSYGGRCGRCEYRQLCGGCRARAYANRGNYMDEDPCCSYVPGPERSQARAGVANPSSGLKMR